MTGARYNLLSALAAFLLWGGWAWLVNRDAPGHSAVVSALIQGACSFVITLFIVRSVSALHRRVRQSQSSRMHRMRIVLPALLTIVATGSALVLAHWLAGTAAIAATVAAPLSVAFAFSLYTTYRLDRQQPETTKP